MRPNRIRPSFFCSNVFSYATPQAPPTITADFNGLNFFCNSFNTNPLHPNSSPSDPRIKLSPKITSQVIPEVVSNDLIDTFLIELINAILLIKTFITLFLLVVALLFFYLIFRDLGFILEIFHTKQHSN